MSNPRTRPTVAARTILGELWPKPHAISQLAAVAAISKRERFLQAVLDAIKRANHLYEIERGLRNTARSKRELNAVAKKGREYSEALKKCSEDTALLLALEPNPYYPIKPLDLSNEANRAGGFASAASRAVALKTPPKHFALRFLVEDLLDAAAAEDVKLTVSDVSVDFSAAGGSLARILNELRDYRWRGEHLVKDGLIPNPIPFKPLQRMSSDWTRKRVKSAK